MLFPNFQWLILQNYLLLNPSLIHITYKFIFALSHVFKIEFGHPVCDVLHDGRIYVGEGNAALVYDFREIVAKEVLPYSFVDPVKLKEVAGH